MNNKFKIAAIFLFLTCFINKPVFSAVLNSSVIADKVKKDVSNQVSTIVKGKIVTDIVNIPYKKIDLPDGKVEVKTSVNLNFFSSYTVSKVNISVNGETVKTFGVPVRIHVFDKVWVAKDIINNGELLSNSNLELEIKDISVLVENATREDFSFDNLKTKRAYKAGDIIDKRYIAKIPNIVRNSIVSIIFQSKNFTMTLSGEALEDGNIGDYIRVRNKQYKKDYIGRIIDVNQILINI